MTLWLVRAGSRGENESLALSENVVVIGWNELGDLSTVRDKDELLERLEQVYPDAKSKTLLNWRSQIWPFFAEMKIGDLVALPLKQRPAIAFGEVTGNYQYRPDFPDGARHTRPVRWIKEVPRSQIDQDLLYSFGAFMTVCRITRNNAEQRILAVLKGQSLNVKQIDEIVVAEDEGIPDLEELALDQIRSFVTRKFKGHRLTEIVAAVLIAQGYTVRIAPEGPDGGVDILAGTGALGFENPRLAVQVKSSDSPVDIKPVRELQGAMKNFKADSGLFVAWGGFKTSVERERARLFFEIRLWNSDDLLQELFRNYEKLPDDLQAEIPLKRIWMLVPSED